MNWEIREKEVRLIDLEGEHKGVVSIEDAVKMAEEVGYDLVEVATSSKPHVCRIMDFGQYKYEQAKKQKQARKRQKTITIKEIKMRPSISGHDYDFKLRHVLKFLEEGDKVRIVVVFRAREITHPEIGRELLNRIAADLEEKAKIDASPAMEGRVLSMVVSPKKAV